MYIETQINCDIGCVRPNNEDMILFAGNLYRNTTYRLAFELGENVRLAAIVADGMGGHNGGEYASQHACELFDDFVANLPANLPIEELETLLKAWAEKTHATIVAKSCEGAEYEGMGTTFCGLLFYEKFILALNIGDSRLYRFRSEILKQITRDHSMRELYNDPTLPSNQIYNSLGAGDSTFMDVTDISENVLPDDMFLVCSDGIVDMISDEEIEDILTNEPTAEKLVTAARNAGGKDNISVILLSITQKTRKHFNDAQSHASFILAQSAFAPTDSKEALMERLSTIRDVWAKLSVAFNFFVSETYNIPYETLTADETEYSEGTNSRKITDIIEQIASITRCYVKNGYFEAITSKLSVEDLQKDLQKVNQLASELPSLLNAVDAGEDSVNTEEFPNIITEKKIDYDDDYYFHHGFKSV